MKWTIKQLMLNLVEKCFFEDPRETEILVRLSTRDKEGIMSHRKLKNDYCIRCGKQRQAIEKGLAELPESP